MPRLPPDAPLTSPSESDSGLARRGFLAAGAGAFLCTIGGERVLLSKPGDAAKADAAARRVALPRARAAAAAPGAGPTEQLTFTAPQPQPGGTAREYWIEARDVLWDIVPTRPRRDEWHGRAVAGLAEQDALAPDRAQERTSARGQEAAAGQAAV